MRPVNASIPRRRLDRSKAPKRAPVLFLLLLLPSVFALGQPAKPSIAGVDVAAAKLPGQSGMLKFTLKITGKDFGADKTKIKVLADPKPPNGPAVDDVSQDGTTIDASLTASEDYLLKTVKVEAPSGEGEPYALPTGPASPAISSVDVSSKPGRQAGTREFTLAVAGEGFGKVFSRISVLVAHKALILKGPEVTEFSQRGTVAVVNSLVASFLAPNDFEPSTVIVQVDTTPSEPYVLPAAAGGECASGDIRQKVCIRLRRAIIDPKDVADILGTRIAKRFVVIQVTVENRSRDYQYLIHDVSVDLAPLVGIVPGEARYELSSTELSLLRGVAEKGQQLDRRNVILRSIRGLGTIATSIAGIGALGNTYSSTAGLVNGPVATAFDATFPDFTLNQMIRLNDSAYLANTLVPKQQSKVIAIFLPQAIFLDQEQRNKFWDDPTSLWNEWPQLDLRKLEVYVDGDFIANVEDLVPSLTDVVIDPSEMKNFQNDKPEVKGSISGNHLSGAGIKLLNQDLPGVGIRLDGTPTEQRLGFILSSDRPIAPDTVLKFGVVKGQSVNESDRAVQYKAAAPTLANVDPPTLTQGDTAKLLTLTGTNFLFGASTKIMMDPPEGVTVASVDVKSSTTLQATVNVADNALAEKRQIWVVTAGGPSQKKRLTTIHRKGQ